MAILTSLELRELMQRANRNIAEQHWDKVQISAALQAIEDRVRAPATQTTIATDIETAVPGIFSADEKRILFGMWCVSAARRLGVI